MNVNIHEFTSWPPELKEQARRLYERSFHPEELNDFDRLFDRGPISDRARLLMAADGDRLLGFSVFRPLTKASLGYLWYLCVDENTRGMGIGSKLYRETVAWLQRLGGLKGMIFEVARLDSESHPVYGDPVRRVQFYERLGARLILGYDYIQPPIPPHGPVPLQLMFHPFEKREWNEEELAGVVSGFLRYGQGIEDNEVEASGLRLASLKDV